jgi:hypothetical protein
MTRTSRSMTVAIVTAAVVTAQFVAGKATRDALFFTSLDVAALPGMLTATAVWSLVLLAVQARIGRRMPPSVFVPASFTVSGALFAAEWLFRSAAPSTTAVLVYLHVSGIGPLLTSGFWLITSERFNPRTAKKGFGRVAAAGTLGGLIGALLAERVAALSGSPAMLVVLAGSQFVTAGLVRMLAISGDTATEPRAESSRRDPMPLLSGIKMIAAAPHLRDVVALVLLGTASAALLDYAFKARAVETFGRGDGLLRFFALYYAGSSLLSFVLQTISSRAVLDRFGLALTASTPSIALVAGSLTSLIAPGFGSLLVARGAEAVFRGSWFRAGYELFYTPIPVAEKRAAKSLIDVGFDRLGDAIGAAMVRTIIVLAPASQSSALLGVAVAASLGAIAAASRLNRWYVRSLENSLVNRAGGLDHETTVDRGTARVLIDIRKQLASDHDDTTVSAEDQLLHDITALRARHRDEIVRILSRAEGPSAALVPYVIPLLATDTLADHALFALRKVAEERVGQLTDALIDPNQDDAVRRRLAHVFSIGVSQRAADGVQLALDDARFDVRYQAARSLAAILDRNPRVEVDRARIDAVVLQEVAVSQPVWESRRLLDDEVGRRLTDGPGSSLDAFVRDRAGQSLGHVFTLLSLVLPREPLQIAFRSLHSEDANLRGTALEYLDGVLPPAIRQRLWPFLVRTRVSQDHGHRRDAIADLLRSSHSLTLRRAGQGAGGRG